MKKRTVTICSQLYLCICRRTSYNRSVVRKIENVIKLYKKQTLDGGCSKAEENMVSHNRPYSRGAERAKFSDEDMVKQVCENAYRQILVIVVTDSHLKPAVPLQTYR